MLELHAIPGAPLEVNCYLVADRAAGEAVLVDAPLQVAEAMTRQAAAWGVRVTALLCTHGHWDHTMGLPELLIAFPAPVAVHAGDADLLEHPTFAPFTFPLTLTPITPDRLLAEGDTVAVGEHILTVLSTPGHTPGSVCFYDAVDALCLTGDTLFQGTHGRTDFPGGDPEAMGRSLLRLRALPPDTRICPGHGPATTIAREGWLAHVEEMDLG